MAWRHMSPITKVSSMVLLASLVLSGWNTGRVGGQPACSSVINDQGRVLFFETRILYAEASREAVRLAKLEGGALLQRAGEPLCRGTQQWLPVEANGRRGWILERENYLVYVEPFLGAPHGTPQGRPHGQLAFGVSNWGANGKGHQH